MSKQWYKVIYKQLQPIHVGQGRFGILGQTRIFIPGWTMWGALTKAFNLKRGENLDQNQDKFKVITNFFPTDDPSGENIWFPHYKNGHFYLGNYREDHFRAAFCEVFMSTAVQAISRQAKEASLHELEFILPKGKSERKQLYWIGLLQIENSSDIPNEIFVGGDRRYGFGLMELLDAIDTNQLQDWQLDENGKFLDNGKSIVHFVVRHDAKDAEQRFSKLNKGRIYASGSISLGELELVPEFEYYQSDKESNYKFNDAAYYYIPGSEFNRQQ